MDQITPYSIDVANETPRFVSALRLLLVRAVLVTGIDLIILTGMAVLFASLVHHVGGHVRWFQTSVILPLAIMAALILYDLGEWIYSSVVHQQGKAHEFLAQIPKILRDWIPFLLIDFIYENLHDLSGHLARHDIAGTLYTWDVKLLGFEPTLWAQRFASPLLTDVMSVFYAVYLALPLTLMFFLSIKDRRDDFRKISIAMSFTFLLGFVGYVVFPAQPPRFFLEAVFTHPVKLQGNYLHYHLQTMWDNLSVVRGAAFPSLHVAISSVALVFAWRFRRISGLFRFFWFLYIPLVVGLWISTIYLRHHWVMDIFAGWVVASVALLLSESVTRLTRSLRTRLGQATDQPL